MLARPPIFLAVVAAIGCSGGDPAPTPAPARPSGAVTETDSATQDPIALAASAFLDAVVKGDTPRATGMLTPDAAAQFAATGQGFASPDIGAPSFRVDQVRRVDGDKAAVQCVLTDADGSAEEMCCLLRFVGSEWRVSGVAYEMAPGEPPVIFNFEQPEQPAPRRDSAAQFVEQPAAGAPIRTAADPSQLPPR
ncbi:MAG: hypothetical protein AAGB00_00275 [Planctomycetota bacterium]